MPHLPKKIPPSHPGKITLLLSIDNQSHTNGTTIAFLYQNRKKMKRIYAKLTSENNASIMSLLAAFLLGVLVTMSCHLLLF
jgi:hypothetical protein